MYLKFNFSLIGSSEPQGSLWNNPNATPVLITLVMKMRINYMMSDTILKWKSQNTKHCNFPVFNYWNTCNYIIESYTYMLSIPNIQGFSSNHCRYVSIEEMSLLLVTNAPSTLHSKKKRKYCKKKKKLKRMKFIF